VLYLLDHLVARSYSINMDEMEPERSGRRTSSGSTFRFGRDGPAMMDMDNDRFHHPQAGPKSPPPSNSKAARRGMGGGESGPGDHRRGARSSMPSGGVGGAGSSSSSKTKFTHTNVIVGTY
jgi:hypothetical protein